MGRGVMSVATCIPPGAATILSAGVRGTAPCVKAVGVELLKLPCGGVSYWASPQSVCDW